MDPQPPATRVRRLRVAAAVAVVAAVAAASTWTGSAVASPAVVEPAGGMTGSLPRRAAGGGVGVLVADTFTRAAAMTAGGWSKTERGGIWSFDRPGAYTSSGGVGRIAMTAGEDRHAMLDNATADTDVTLRFQVTSIPATGSGVYVGVTMRQDRRGNAYRTRVRVLPDGTARVSLVRVVGPTQALTSIGPEVTLPLKVKVGAWYQMRTRAVGSTAVSLAGVVWPVGRAQPAWSARGTDRSSARLAGPGRTGLYGYVSRSGSATRVNVDDVVVVDLAGGRAPISTSRFPPPTPMPGWGTPTVGGTYTLRPVDQFMLTDATGSVALRPGEERHATYQGRSLDTSSTFRFSVASIPAAGSGVYIASSARIDAAGRSYRVRLRILAGGASYLSVVRVDDVRRNPTTIGREVTVPFTVVPNTWYRLRTKVSGTDAVSFAASVWPDGTPEPVWMLSRVDASPGRRTNIGGFGLYWYLSGAATRTTIAIDDVEVVAPASGTPPGTTQPPTTQPPTTQPPTTQPPTTQPPTTQPVPRTADPVAQFAMSAAGNAAAFDASASSDSDGDPLSFEWSFGDGTTATGPRPTHTYRRAGTYQVTLRARDGRGGTAQLSKSITVGPPGASLPVSYDLSTITAPIVVATNGSDAAAGTLADPLATVAAALARIGPGQTATIVVRGGTYRQGNLRIPAGVKVRIVAHPGEIPVFNGAKVMTSWVPDGTQTYHPYTPRPVTDGSGISFTTGQNLSGDGIGRFPDQVWVGQRALRQVSSKAAVTNDTFWVDRPAGRLYVTAVNAAAGVEASDRNQFVNIEASDTTIEGVVVTRFSNTAADYGVILVQSPANRVVLRHLEVSDSAYQAIKYAGNSALLSDALLENVTVTRSNWMGVDATLVDRFTMRSVMITDSNLLGEFTAAPQSGALKTSRASRVLVERSLITNNRSHGLWFDQSNVDVDVVSNIITNNSEAGVFFEISDDLLLADNVIRASSDAQPVRIAGSSRVKIVNNTIAGGSDPIGIYTDSRSRPGCADPAMPLCAGSYSSDRDTARPRPVTLDWMPRVDVLANNVIASAQTTRYCGTPVLVCVTASNSGATAPIDTIFHQADTRLGIDTTIVDGNVYVSGTSGVIHSSTLGQSSTLASFIAGMATIDLGVEGRGKAGAWASADGTPTAALSAAHDQALPLPALAATVSLPAGTRHYGSLIDRA